MIKYNRSSILVFYLLMCTLTFPFWERKLYFSTLLNNSFIIRSLDTRYDFYPASLLLPDYSAICWIVL